MFKLSREHPRSRSANTQQNQFKFKYKGIQAIWSEIVDQLMALQGKSYLILRKTSSLLSKVSAERSRVMEPTDSRCRRRDAPPRFGPFVHLQLVGFLPPPVALHGAGGPSLHSSAASLLLVRRSVCLLCLGLASIPALRLHSRNHVTATQAQQEAEETSTVADRNRRNLRIWNEERT